MIVCIGWIPNLTGNIFLNNPFKKDCFKPIEAYSKKITPKEYQEYQNKYDIFIEEKNVSDIPEIKQHLTFLYAVEKDGDHIPFEIKIYNTNDPFFELVCDIKNIKIDGFGLIQFEASTLFEGDSNFYKDFLNNVFICIRDVYHEHTHHDGDYDCAADSLTTLIFEKSEKESILEIINNFQRKIIQYHKEVKGLIKSSGKHPILDGTVDSIRQAKAEFIYALNFLKYYEKFFTNDEIKIFKQVFNHAILSCETSFAEINTKFHFESLERAEACDKIITEMTKQQTTLIQIQNTESQELKKLTKYLYILTIGLILLGFVTVAITWYYAIRHEGLLELINESVKSLKLI